MRWCCVLVALLSTRAHAGRTSFAWPYDTELLKANKLELQTWVTEENRDATNETELWWLPVLGATSSLEVALPIVFARTRADGMADDFTLDRYGLEARYRFPIQPIVPLIRAAILRTTEERASIRVEADAVVSYAFGAVRTVADLSYVGSHDEQSLYPSIGVSLRVYEGLRFGIEAVAEIEDAKELEWIAAGPDIAWSAGRFWVSASAPIGIKGIHTAPRLLWGVLF